MLARRPGGGYLDVTLLVPGEWAGVGSGQGAFEPGESDL